MNKVRAKVAVIGLTGNSVFMGVPGFHTGGETVVAHDFHSELGGKGFNQAVAAARQGADVSLLTAVGNADVERVGRFLSGENISGFVVGKEVPSAHATILTDGSGQTRVTVFPGATLAAGDVDRFADSIKNADMLLLGNEVPEDVNIRAAEIASSSGVRILVNPAPSRPLPKELREKAFLFTPNEFEEAGLGEVQCEVVTTLGEKGCLIRSTRQLIPAVSCGNAVDSTGAGDTFTATLAVCMAEGMALSDACRIANIAAGQSVTVRYVLPSLPFRICDGQREFQEQKHVD